MARMDFDSTGIDTSSSFDALPAGKYIAMATEGVMKDTKKGDGQYLNLVFEILDGEFKGRKIFDRMNLNNSNNQAVAIAQKQLAKLVQACGKTRIIDSDELLNIPVIIKLKVRKGNEQYPDDSNKISDYFPCAEFSHKRPKSIDGQPLGKSKPPWAIGFINNRG